MDYSQYLTADVEVINYVKHHSKHTDIYLLMKTIFSIARYKKQYHYHGIYYYTKNDVDQANIIIQKNQPEIIGSFKNETNN